MAWDKGRQGSGYFKKKLFESTLLRCDLYLLKIPAGVGVPEHTDPAPDGFNHWRLNIELGSMARTGQTIVKGWYNVWLQHKDQMKFRVVLFNASKLQHEYTPGEQDALFISFGFLRRDSQEPSSQHQ